MSRAEDLAKQFEAANAQAIATIEGLSDEQWRKTCSAETWSVGVTAHHVAGGHAIIAGIGQAIGKGQPIPPITMDDINKGNAQHAVEFANCTKADTLEILRSGGAQAAGLVRTLSDAELDHSVELALMGGQKVSAEQFIQMVLLGHLQEHLTSIGNAIGS